MKRYLLAGLVLIVIIGGVFFGTRKAKTTVPVAQATSGHYVALGDSVAAGVGLATASDSSACDRTDEAYPHAVGAALNLSVTNLACSGATLPSGITGSQTVNQLALPTQLDQLFAEPKPKVISLSIGANDADWTSVIAKCYTGVCGTAADTAAITSKLATVTQNVQAVLTTISAHYSTQAPNVVVVGYHQVFPTTTATCSDLTGIDATELSWGRAQQTAINTALESAVSGFSFVRYAPVDFSGHELCTSESWVQGLSAKYPYHPTAAGQAALAKAVVITAKSFK
jgi:lysophospholipase L1-like esterase